MPFTPKAKGKQRLDESGSLHTTVKSKTVILKFS
jgi:hypothetical protein